MTSPRPLAPDNSPSSESSASSDLSTEPSNSFESGRTVRSYMEDLKHPQAMEHAERQARQMIQSLENAPAEDGGRSPNIYSNPAIPDVEVKLHKILEAMLANAEACGGSHGKCYTIASICSAGRSSKSKEEDDIQFLRNLGVTWLSNFLWVFKANHPSYLRNARMRPSQLATPTGGSDSTLLSRCDQLEALRCSVLKRDEYRCCITGYNDHQTPKLSPDVTKTRKLNVCRIVRRVVGPFDKITQPEAATNSHRIIANTFDIICNYSNMPGDEVECLTANIDKPQNGFTLEMNVHDSFDNFYWCLHPVGTGRENEYQVKEYDPARSSIESGDETPIIVRFEDHSGSYDTGVGKGSRSPTESIQEARGVPVPDPLFFRIHAAVAGVLHMSGATEVIDLLLERFESIGPAGDIFTAEDFESPGLVDLKQSIQKMQLEAAY